MNESLLQDINVQQAVPFFMVRNMNDSLSFYVDGLGFVVKIKWEPNGKLEWCWLQLGNASLMLQEYRNSIPSTKRGVGVSVAFICRNALVIYNNALANGLQPREPFVGNNQWVVELTDPDGYPIFFESPTDVEEGTTYFNWKK